MYLNSIIFKIINKMVELNNTDLLKQSIKAKSERSKPGSHARVDRLADLMSDLERGGVQTPDLDMLKAG